MNEDMMLDLNKLRTEDRPGLQLDGKVYPWSMVGPVEAAVFTKHQQEIASMGDENDGALDEEAAKHVVDLQRRILKVILPTLPDDVATDITDDEVGTIIRFFDVWRTNRAVDDLERQLEPAQRARDAADRIASIGDRLSQRSRGSTAANQRPG